GSGNPSWLARSAIASWLAPRFGASCAAALSQASIRRQDSVTVSGDAGRGAGAAAGAASARRNISTPPSVPTASQPSALIASDRTSLVLLRLIVFAISPCPV